MNTQKEFIYERVFVYNYINISMINVIMTHM